MKRPVMKAAELWALGGLSLYELEVTCGSYDVLDEAMAYGRQWVSDIEGAEEIIPIVINDKGNVKAQIVREIHAMILKGRTIGEILEKF